MLSFVIAFALAHVAAALLASGLGHLARFPAFRALLREHAVFPARCALPVAVAVAGIELAAGGAAVAAFVAGASPAQHALLFAACAALGGAFTLYVRALLRRPVRSGSCGCSPITSPLTPASMVPALALLAASLAGAGAAGLRAGAGVGAAAAAVGASEGADPLAPLLAALWGLTLAGLQFLYPTTVPAAVARVHA